MKKLSSGISQSEANNSLNSLAMSVFGVAKGTLVTMLTSGMILAQPAWSWLTSSLFELASYTHCTHAAYATVASRVYSRSPLGRSLCPPIMHERLGGGTSWAQKEARETKTGQGVPYFPKIIALNTILQPNNKLHIIFIENCLLFIEINAIKWKEMLNKPPIMLIVCTVWAQMEWGGVDTNGHGAPK